MENAILCLATVLVRMVYTVKAVKNHVQTSLSGKTADSHANAQESTLKVVIP